MRHLVLNIRMYCITLVFFASVLISNESFSEEEIDVQLGPWEGSMSLEAGETVVGHYNQIKKVDSSFPASFSMSYTRSGTTGSAAISASSNDRSDGFRVSVEWERNPVTEHWPFWNLDADLIAKRSIKTYDSEGSLVRGGYAIVDFISSGSSSIRVYIDRGASGNDIQNVPKNGGPTVVFLNSYNELVITGGSAPNGPSATAEQYDSESSIDVRVLPLEELNLTSVDDTDPANPIVNFDLLCDECIVVWKFDGDVGVLGTMNLNRGQHSININAIRQRSPGRHNFVVSARSLTTGHIFSDEAAINIGIKSRELNQVPLANVYIPVELIGRRTVTKFLSADVYFHEWELPGATYDRWIKNFRSTMCALELERSPVISHFSWANLIWKDGAGNSGKFNMETDTSASVQAPTDYCASFVSDFELYVKSSGSEIFSKFWGQTESPGGSPGWVFWPSWPTIGPNEIQ